MGACPFKTTGDLIAFRDLLLDGKYDVGETRAYRAEDVLETFESRTLSRQWNLLDNVFPNILTCRVDLPLGNYFVHKAADDLSIILRHVGSPRDLVRVVLADAISDTRNRLN